MPRAVAIGIALTVVSAFAFGSGALFAKPVYAEGVGWHVLMAWRFIVGAGLAWIWLLARRASEGPQRRHQVNRLQHIRLSLRIVANQQVKAGPELRVHPRVVAKVPQPQMTDMHVPF